MKLSPTTTLTSQSQSNELKDYRCQCGKLLFKGLVVTGIIEIKCKRCQSLIKLSLAQA